MPRERVEIIDHNGNIKSVEEYTVSQEYVDSLSFSFNEKDIINGLEVKIKKIKEFCNKEDTLDEKKIDDLFVMITESMVDIVLYIKAQTLSHRVQRGDV